MDQTFEFHDGLRLSKGAKIIFPSLAIHMDPANYKNPQIFDGYRFVRDKGGRGRYSSTVAASTVDSTFLQYVRVKPAASHTYSRRFGYGKHACPGRFYAVKKAKLVLGRLLQQYDFMWDGQVDSRPPGIAIEAQMVANPHARVLFRSRGL